MWLPGPLYEALPYLYLVASVAAILSLNSFFALVSGCLFAVAGVWVWRLRRQYRTLHDRW
jgi:hypothetical protein